MKWREKKPRGRRKKRKNAQGRRVGWVKCRWLGAIHSGAEPPGRPFPRAQELGASDHGAELGASHSGAEPRVHFRNFFRQGSICEKLSKKGQIVKNSVLTSAYRPSPTSTLYIKADIRTFEVNDEEADGIEMITTIW